MDSAALIAAIAACSAFAAQLLNLYVQSRNHRWDVEERARLAIEHSHERETVATESRSARALLAERLDESELRKSVALEKLATAQREMARLLSESERDKIDAIERVAAEQREMTRQTHEKIDENTEISTRAFHEANSVNLKIASLGKEILLKEEEHG